MASSTQSTQGGRGRRPEVVHVTPEVSSAPVVLPFVDGVASLPAALGLRDYSGLPRDAGRCLVPVALQAAGESIEGFSLVVYDFGAGSFSSGVAVSHCPDACYVACDLYDPADRVVTDMLRVRNADGIRAAYIQGRPAAAPTLNELAHVLWDTWRLPVSALGWSSARRIVAQSPVRLKVSSIGLAGTTLIGLLHRAGRRTMTPRVCSSWIWRRMLRVVFMPRRSLSNRGLASRQRCRMLTRGFSSCAAVLGEFITQITVSGPAWRGHKRCHSSSFSVTSSRLRCGVGR